MRFQLRLWVGVLVLGCAACGGCGPGDGGTDGGGGGRSGGSGGSTGGGGSGGSGGSTGSVGSGGGGAGGFGGGAVQCNVLPVTYRDFKGVNEDGGHPDFESKSGRDPTTGLVLPQLGTDRKPVYSPDASTLQLTGPAEFAQWYRDTPAVNRTVNDTLTLTSADGGSDLVFDSAAFFPLDGRGFGNTPGRTHNFHFTTEIHATFTYRGGEVFDFRGDDDVWVFINNRLALDLGGLHPPRPGTINFDAQAAQLGLVRGNTYAFDVFHAERHTSASNFRIVTSIDCFIIN